ncbi:cytochrome c family protein [Oligoflexaceae bacterium]|nr:cytochrome c family protein [Oligoflexaceae bacterium]
MNSHRSSFNLRILTLMVALLLSGTSYAWHFWTPGDTVDNVGYKPKQPIPYSHKLHAGQMEIPCEYCHSSARRSFSAGIPSTNTCMGCHKYAATDKEAIKFITEKYKKNEPIEWVKVHDLPDFVRFPHKRHVKANVPCQECHGDVENMEVVEQVAPLQMGWCVGCHKERKAPLQCYTCHY